MVAVLTTGIVGCQATQSLPRLQPVSIASAQTDPQSAVEDTIARADKEQAQALAAGDPSPMADTATAHYLQQLTQTNQQLAKDGVVSIALDDISWGPVSVSGTTATATSYETWTTTLAGGGTLQSQDENDYTLTLGDDGSWLIASDTQPTSAAGAGQPASIPTSPAASTPSGTSTSSNWSGYAATNGTYTSVNGTWTVAQYSASSSAGVGATWVGIGGVSSTDLIQAGTQEQTSGTGQTEYQAWIEMLPQASRTIPLSVHAGDSVSVSIAEQGTNSWLISFQDNTTGQSYQQTVQYRSSLSSAEWIEEAPSAGRGRVLPLDNFGTVTFSDATAVKDGQTVSLSAAGASSITLVGTTRQALAVPSSIASDGESFSVSRTSAAATISPTFPDQLRSQGRLAIMRGRAASAASSPGAMYGRP